MPLNEADTCRRYVVPKLQAAGWETEPHRINEQVTFTGGRIARVMLNAELVHGKRSRIIIPTGLPGGLPAGPAGNTDPYIRMLDRAQDFTARIDFNDYERALAQLRATNAFLEPHEGQLRMPRQAVAT